MGSSNSARHAYIVGSKWIYKIKRYVDGSIQRYKASLVAQGYNQKYGWDYDELFASVVRQSTFHILLEYKICISNTWMLSVNS